jgi:hypothetical protein
MDGLVAADVGVSAAAQDRKQAPTPRAAAACRIVRRAGPTDAFFITLPPLNE